MGRNALTLIYPFIEENGEQKDDDQNPDDEFKPFIVKKTSHAFPSRRFPVILAKPGRSSAYAAFT